MSTPDQPGSPPLTRRQIREIRNTGATPIIDPDTTPAPAPDATASAPEPVVTEAPAPTVSAPEPVSAAPVHLARAAEPAHVADAPVSDASVDLGVSPLTRRQARQQERIRTASVPVITPDLLAAHTAPMAPIDAVPLSQPAESVDEDSADRSSFEDLFADASDGTEAVAATEIVVVDAQPDDAIVQADAEAHAVIEDDLPAALDTAVDDVDDAVDDGDRAVVSPVFGAELLAGEPTTVTLPPTFDQLLTHSTSGSTATPNALIVSQTSGSSPLVAPVAATGEVLITGTFNLPEGLGSLGHTPSTADGKDVDAVLVDGELPAHSSPTPIAASAAISTVKTTGDIIKPPVPEKGNKLMISLAITAGALAAALLAVLAIALISGVFQ